MITIFYSDENFLCKDTTIALFNLTKHGKDVKKAIAKAKIL